jgi:hypothetical protein
MVQGNVPRLREESMSWSAPLRVTAEIRMHEGPAAGERRFRLSQSIALPPALRFAAGLPLEGRALGEVRFELPGSQPIRCRVLLHHDPEHPGRGSEAELLDLTPEVLETVKSYIENHQRLTERLTS